MRGVFSKAGVIVRWTLMAAVAIWFSTQHDAFGADRIERRSLLKEQLLKGGFAALENDLGKLLAGYKAGQISEGAIDADFSTYWDSDEALADRLDAWVRHSTSSVAARLASGLYYERLGWLARGTAYIPQTSSERIRRMKGYFARAQNHLEDALRLDSRLVPAYSALANITMALGRRDEAGRHLKTGLETNPKSYGMHLQCLESLEPKWGGSMEAIAAYIRLNASVFSDDANLKSLLGYPQAMIGDKYWGMYAYPAAERAYSAALMFGESTRIQLRRSRMRLFIGDLDGAQGDAEAALEGSGNPAAAYAAIASVRQRKNDAEGALAAWNLAVKFDKRNPDFLIGRAAVFTLLKQYEKAEVDFNAGLEFGVDVPRLYDERRKMFQDAGRHEEAIRDALTAVKLKPDYSRYWMSLAEALTLRQDCRAFEALSQFKSRCATDNTCSELEARSFLDVMRNMPCPSAGRKELGTPH